jgi:predicted nucleic acid-binding Zn ribbon protein
MSALIVPTSNGELMAEIRVAPQRRNRAMMAMIVIALILVAVVAWYFLAGPGAGA